MAIEKKMDEVELTEEENKGQLRAYENDICGLLAAKATRRKRYPADRNHEMERFFFFRIRPSRTNIKSKEKHKIFRNKQLGSGFGEHRQREVQSKNLPAIEEDREKTGTTKAWKA